MGANKNGRFVALRKKNTLKERVAGVCWKRNMGFGGSSQYVFAAAPLAVRMLSSKWHTHSGLLCVARADAASGLAPDFLLRVPVQSILLCSSLPIKKAWPTGNSNCNSSTCAPLTNKLHVQANAWFLQLNEDWEDVKHSVTKVWAEITNPPRFTHVIRL